MYYDFEVQLPDAPGNLLMKNMVIRSMLSMNMTGFMIRKRSSHIQSVQL